ncbi:hypothetical protein Ahy_B03g066344 [Arachis hypogaea]|uniref:PB1-like domain-containing protein n=1 Tax=Arachis hypogaea TaxID=3818 RepID=A0A445A3V8_ARAHY|nr:hypothetical protein Ahy_B03g066344 [Arachis hypogaea]
MDETSLFERNGDFDGYHCWWLPPRRSLDGGLRDLTSDDELRKMCFAARQNDGVVDVYFEHGVSTPELLAGKEVVF